jgi:predicted ATPase
MKRYILTGTPGAGKTAILRCLELDGYGVVEEAATDIIAVQQAQGVAEPWSHASFIDAIVTLQRERQLRAARLGDGKQFFDRSPICTYALAKYLGYPISTALSTEIERIEQDAIYQKRVFFVQSLGFITATDARRITPEDAMRFERVHEEAYRGFDYQIVPIATTAPRAISRDQESDRRSPRQLDQPFRG